MTETGTTSDTGDRAPIKVYDRCEALPANPPPGDYVVIDTFHFSNTVIELLANGAQQVHITDDRTNSVKRRSRINRP